MIHIMCHASFALHPFTSCSCCSAVVLVSFTEYCCIGCSFCHPIGTETPRRGQHADSESGTSETTGAPVGADERVFAC